MIGDISLIFFISDLCFNIFAFETVKQAQTFTLFCYKEVRNVGLVPNKMNRDCFEEHSKHMMMYFKNWGDCQKFHIIKDSDVSSYKYVISLFVQI